jgi:hypothetical protein
VVRERPEIDHASTQKGNLDLAEPVHDTIGPRSLEVWQPAERRQEIDPVWRQTELDHRVGSCEVSQRDLEIVEWCAEVSEGPPDAFRVRRLRIDPHIQILSAERYPVHCHGMGADYEESGAGSGKRCEEILPVVRYHFLTMLTGISLRRYDGIGRPVSAHIRRVSTTTIARRSSGVELLEMSSPGSAPSL